MRSLIALLIVATVTITPAHLFSQSASIEIETKSVLPGESVFLRIMLETDCPISAAAIPVAIEDTNVIIDSVSWEHTIFQPDFSDTTLLCDTLRRQKILVIPYIFNPIPSIPPPGGEICRLYFTVKDSAPSGFITVDSFYTITWVGDIPVYDWVELSDPNGLLILPDFQGGGITVGCGDADGNGVIDVADATFLVDYIFIAGSPAPNPIECGDADCNGIVEVSDVIYLLNFIFSDDG